MPAGSRLTLCMDARMLAESAGTGVATYARGLRAAQRSLGDACLLTDGFVGRMGERRSRSEKLRRWLATRRDVPVAAPSAAEGLVGADIFRRAQVHFDRHGTLMRVVPPPGPAGIMHWTYPVPIRLCGWRNVYTIHDAIPLMAPDLSPIDPVRHRRLLTAIAGAADGIVTVSAAARADIAATLNLDPGRVVDCGQAVSPVVAGRAGAAGLEPGGYFLFCGSIEPRKNLIRLAAAWAASGVTTPLVVVGGDGWRAETILPALDAAGVIRLPYLPTADLHAVQAGARGVLFPTLAEGFGLPIIEAMGFGVPVLTSRYGATAEVAGGAALLVDPTDTAAIADAIRRLDGDAPLRATLASAGRARSGVYAPAAFANRLAALYATMLVSDGPHPYRDVL
ncbi:hypothetical protein ASE75_02590 [Sphingomonas sp. Leaf17]|nr:hypothetical protein ASE75_02590 [Sphingomonas sp. Leaf17]